MNELFKFDEAPADHLATYVTAEVLAGVLGLSKKRISNMVLEEKLTSDGHNKYHLVNSVRAYIATIKNNQPLKRSEFDDARLEKVQRENLIASNNLINREAAEQSLMSLASIVVDQLESLAPRTAAALAAESDAAKLQANLYDECRRIRETISRNVENSEIMASVRKHNTTAAE